MQRKARDATVHPVGQMKQTILVTKVGVDVKKMAACWGGHTTNGAWKADWQPLRDEAERYFMTQILFLNIQGAKPCPQELIQSSSQAASFIRARSHLDIDQLLNTYTKRHVCGTALP